MFEPVPPNFPPKFSGNDRSEANGTTGGQEAAHSKPCVRAANTGTSVAGAIAPAEGAAGRKTQLLPEKIRTRGLTAHRAMMGFPSSLKVGQRVSPHETQTIAFPGGFKDAKGARKKRSKRGDACYDKRSDSWVGNGRRPDGTRWRRQGFPDEASARNWALQTKGEMDELGYKAADLPAAVRRDVAHALSLRAQAGLSAYEEGMISRMVKDDIARNPKGHKMTLTDAIEKWRASKHWTKPRTMRDAKDLLAPFYDELGSRLITQIARPDVESVLGPRTGYRRRNILVKISEVFTYCQENRFLGSAPEDHPCYGIKTPRIEKGLPTPMSVGDARKLVALAIQTEESLGCTAWVSSCLFLAFRDSEAAMVLYDAVNGINTSRGFAYLTKEVAKMRERTVHFDPAHCPKERMRPFIPHNFLIILSELPQKYSGPLAPKRRKIDLFKAYARHCEIIWEDNGLRAGFATHHFALHRDAEISAEIMGHLPKDGGVEVFYKHYYRYADYEAGKAYFEIGLYGLKRAAAEFAPPITLAEFEAMSPKNEGKRSRKRFKKRPEWDKLWETLT
jgi:hypothetical protein